MIASYRSRRQVRTYYQNTSTVDQIRYLILTEAPIAATKRMVVLPPSLSFAYLSLVVLKRGYRPCKNALQLVLFNSSSFSPPNMRLFLLLSCILASILVYSNAFVQPTNFRAGVKDTRTMNLHKPMISVSSTSLSSLQSSSSLKLSPWDKDDDNVNVQELEVDAFTLTW